MTIKQRKFIRELIRTGEPTESAMRSYKCKDRKVARVIASQLLSKLNIDMIELMDKMGIDTESDLRLLEKLRSAKVTKAFSHEGQVVDEFTTDDNSTQLKALELTLKLKGKLKGDGANINVNKTTYNVDNRRTTTIFSDIDDDLDDVYETEDDTQQVYAEEGTQGNRIKEAI